MASFSPRLMDVTAPPGLKAAYGSTGFRRYRRREPLFFRYFRRGRLKAAYGSTGLRRAPRRLPFRCPFRRGRLFIVEIGPVMLMLRRDPPPRHARAAALIRCGPLMPRCLAENDRTKLA